MASNINVGTISGSSTASGAKRRTTRKAGAEGAESRVAAKKAAPVEIVFKELPNPFRQPEPPYIWIDHPQQNERLMGSVYVIRLGVGGAETVELSIDKGDYQPCRFTAGYWWFDWSNIQPGKHSLVARMKTTDGRWFKTPPRNCEYRS